MKETKETIMIQYVKFGTDKIELITNTICKFGFLTPFLVVIPA